MKKLTPLQDLLKVGDCHEMALPHTDGRHSDTPQDDNASVIKIHSHIKTEQKMNIGINKLQT